MNAKPALVRPQFASEFDPQIALWIARLSTTNVLVLNYLNDGAYAEEVRQLIGITPRDNRINKTALRPLLKQRSEELKKCMPRRQTVLTRNVNLLAKLLGLSALQAEILSFVALSQQHPFFAEVIETVRTTSIDAITKLLAQALNAREAEIRTAMQPEGQLRDSRVVFLDNNGIGRCLQLEVPVSLRTAMFSNAANIKTLMDSFLERAPCPSLKSDAFAHLLDETQLLQAYLSKASSKGARGINVLIYGPPGTGKTEYVRWLAAEQGKSLFQVKSVDDQRRPVAGDERLAFYQLSQRFLQKSDALILFDEMEDVFPAGMSMFGFFMAAKPIAGKLFINRMLENNPVPTIWVSNQVEQIDKAYLRRFDYSFEMSIPPIGVRRGILQTYLGHYAISEASLHYLSQQAQLSPAQIEKAAKVLRVTGQRAKSGEATLLQVIEKSQQLLAQEESTGLLNLEECSYQLDYLNPDCDLSQLVTQLKANPDAVGALCFYGPPGTGKTALAHYIAQAIERPLFVRRASDIIYPYVGETEQKIAAMFKQAKQDGAMLLLDEADSFLSERQSAQHGWEVTAVNEMLTQMEAFDGLFICSTNLMQRLDAASLRRFALKIKFDYLQPEQRWRLFCTQAKKLSLKNETEYRSALNQLSNLTPGDFATVRRQAKLLNVTLTAEELLQRLKHECQSKTGSSRQIGFMSHP